MKKYCVSLACLAVLALCAAPAMAIPPFNEAFKKIYVKDGTPLSDKVATEKCNVCHVGKEKKEKNEFGKVVGKYLKKADFAGDDKKFDPKSDEGQKKIAEGLEKALEEKSSGGKTYLELIKEGNLPGTTK